MGHISQGLSGLEAALANHDNHHVPLLVFTFVVYLSLLSFPVSTSHAPLLTRYTGRRPPPWLQLHGVSAATINQEAGAFSFCDCDSGMKEA